MRLFREYKEQYRLLLGLAIPSVMSQIGQIVVQFADNAMVGRLGATELAAASFANTIFFVSFILCIGISLGLTPLIGEKYSVGEHRKSADYLQNSILLYLLVGLFSFGVQLVLIPFLYHMGQPTEVVDLALPYYKYLVLSTVPFMIYAVFKQFLEGVGNTTVTMVIVVVTNVVNIVLNYLLIYGKFGFPDMGVAGAGVATLVARVCMPIMVVAYFSMKPKFRRYYKFFKWSNFSLRRMKSLLAVGLPIAVQIFMEGGAFAAIGIMMGWIGATEIAANQIAVVISNFAFMMIIGVASATTIRISHEYGRGDMVVLKKAANASFHISIAWSIFTATLFIAFRKYIPLIISTDPQVVELASTLMIFVAAFQISDGLQATSIGILRGIKDVKSIMYIAFFSYIVVNFPIGYFCTFVLGWGAVGLWVGIICGLTTAAVLLMVRFKRKYAKLRERSIMNPTYAVGANE